MDLWKNTGFLGDALIFISSEPFSKFIHFMEITIKVTY